MTVRTEVVVVGGGVTGLVAPRRLAAAGAGVTLLERSSRLGGLVTTDHDDGFVIEGGADSFVAGKGSVLALARELGLDEQVVSSRPEHRGSYVWCEKQQHALLGRPTLNVGVIQGGIQVNQVPDSCAIELDRRMLPGETRQQVWQEFESLIDELRLRDPAMDVEMEPPMLESFPLETAPTERIVQAVTAASQEVRGPSQLIGVPYGSDASRFAIAGIPSVILGPGSIDQAHAAEEYVDLDQVVGAVEIYARAILEF